MKMTKNSWTVETPQFNITYIIFFMINRYLALEILGPRRVFGKQSSLWTDLKVSKVSNVRREVIYRFLERHILQVKTVRYVLSCCHGNKITEGTSQDLAPQKSEKSAICRDIELKFGVGTNFGALSSQAIIKFQSDVNLTSL